MAVGRKRVLRCGIPAIHGGRERRAVVIRRSLSGCRSTTAAERLGRLRRERFEPSGERRARARPIPSRARETRAPAPPPPSRPARPRGMRLRPTHRAATRAWRKRGGYPRSRRARARLRQREPRLRLARHSLEQALELGLCFVEAVLELGDLRAQQRDLDRRLSKRAPRGELALCVRDEARIAFDAK